MAGSPAAQGRLKLTTALSAALARSRDDLLVAGGLGCIVGGVWWIYRPAGVIALGLVLVLLALGFQRLQAARKEPPHAG